MTLEQLRIFLAVAEQEHVTRAAEQLRLTPSAVSSAIRALEQRHDVVLFHRIARRIELTDAGRRFVAEARAVLARAEAAELSLQELAGLVTGRLAVSASQTVANYWLPRYLLDFHLSYPGVDLQMAVGNTRTVSEAVLDGRADIGFLEGEIDEPALSVRPIGRDRLIVVVGPDHPWAGQAIDADAIAAGRWVMREKGSGTRSEFEQALAASGVEAASMDVALELPSNEAVCAAIRYGPFAGIVSELVAQSDLAAGRLARVKFPLPERRFHVATHKERYRSRGALALEALCRGEAPDKSRRR